MRHAASAIPRLFPLMAVLAVAVHGTGWSAESGPTQVALADLPFPVHDTAVAAVAGQRLQDITVVTGDGVRIYHVRYRDATGQMQTAKIDGNGRLLVAGATPETPAKAPPSAGIPLSTAADPTRSTP